MQKGNKLAPSVAQPGFEGSCAKSLTSTLKRPCVKLRLGVPKPCTKFMPAKSMLDTKFVKKKDPMAPCKKLLLWAVLASWKTSLQLLHSGVIEANKPSVCFQKLPSENNEGSIASSTSSSVNLGEESFEGPQAATTRRVFSATNADVGRPVSLPRAVATWAMLTKAHFWALEAWRKSQLCSSSCAEPLLTLRHLPLSRFTTKPPWSNFHLWSVSSELFAPARA
mmetsp:Transcript_58979/g.152401  ORF Transcript_58979/g.152401 Transcript_58979/m.152401 type:complete len:223 (+) Transcript_58979:308-976(+)